MKTTLAARVDNFDSTLGHLNKHQANFIVRTHGLSKTIKIGSKSMRFYDSKYAGAFLCSMVKRDIDKFLEKNKPPFSHLYIKVFNLQYVNESAIEKNLHMPIDCIDLNHCYFTTALNLGYISKRTFLRGTAYVDKAGNRVDLKNGILAAIGRLNSVDMFEEYKNGKKVREWPDWETNRKYSPFYWEIIMRIWRLMEDCKMILGDDLYMWLTDCCYVHPSRRKEVEKLFSERGYEFKNFKSDFESIDPVKRTVVWYDAKASRKKSITYINK